MNSDEINKEIAKTFDINITHETSKIMLKSPLVKKYNIGTLTGINEVLKPLIGEAEVIKHEPFTFSLKVSPNLDSIIDFKEAREYVEVYKPLRDKFINFKLDFPSINLPINYPLSIQTKFNLNKPLNINEFLQNIPHDYHYVFYNKPVDEIENAKSYYFMFNSVLNLLKEFFNNEDSTREFIINYRDSLINFDVEKSSDLILYFAKNANFYDKHNNSDDIYKAKSLLTSLINYLTPWDMNLRDLTLFYEKTVPLAVEKYLQTDIQALKEQINYYQKQAQDYLNSSYGNEFIQIAYKQKDILLNKSKELRDKGFSDFISFMMAKSEDSYSFWDKRNQNPFYIFYNQGFYFINNLLTFFDNFIKSQSEVKIINNEAVLINDPYSSFNEVKNSLFKAIYNDEDAIRLFTTNYGESMFYFSPDTIEKFKE